MPRHDDVRAPPTSRESRDRQRGARRGINFVDTGGRVLRGRERADRRQSAASGKRAASCSRRRGSFRSDAKDPNARGLSRRYLIQACEASLKRLKTDWIDLYQVHRPQSDIPIDETLRARRPDPRRQGALRRHQHVPRRGRASRRSGPRRAWLESLRVRADGVQPARPRTAEREVIPAAQSFGMALMPWAPLCGGLPPASTSATIRRGWVAGRAARTLSGGPVTPAAFDVIEGVVAPAREKAHTRRSLRFAWNMRQRRHHGADRRAAHASSSSSNSSGASRRDGRRCRPRRPRRARRRRGRSLLRYYDAALADRGFRLDLARWSEAARACSGLTPALGVLPFGRSRRSQQHVD